MPQQSLFPIRYGLNVPRGENLQSAEVLCEGGEDLTQSVLETKPGFATQLINFEVSLTGGYRRINGYQKFSNTIVPGQGQILGVHVYVPGFIIADRRDTGNPTKYKVFTGGGTSWTAIDDGTLAFSSGMLVNSCYYNWTGTYRIVFTDGINPAYKWNGTTFTKLNGSGSPANPKFCQEFAGYLFLAGYTSNAGAVTISSPLTDTDYQPVNGAAEVVIGDTITWLQAWRDQLIIFCKSSIHRIVGNSTNPFSSTPFTVQQITDRVGCLEGRTVQEINGDLVFLAPDGLRTISGTFKIGDTEIGSISRPIQSVVSNINPITNILSSCVIHRKTQYRLFYNSASTTQAASQGIMAAIRRFRDGHEDWEFAQLHGIPAACANSNYWISDGNEYVMFGGYDGFVYRMEQGGTFDGAPVSEVYTTVPLELGDRAIRKVLHRITLYCSMGISSLVPALRLAITYDLNRAGAIQPNPVLITALGQSQSAVYDTPEATYDTAGVVWDAKGLPFIRQVIQGSGFVAQFTFSSINAILPYTIQGFEVEYFPAGRR